MLGRGDAGSGGGGKQSSPPAALAPPFRIVIPVLPALGQDVPAYLSWWRGDAGGNWRDPVQHESHAQARRWAQGALAMAAANWSWLRGRELTPRDASAFGGRQAALPGTQSNEVQSDHAHCRRAVENHTLLPPPPPPPPPASVGPHPPTPLLQATVAHKVGSQAAVLTLTGKSWEVAHDSAKKVGARDGPPPPPPLSLLQLRSPLHRRLMLLAVGGTAAHARSAVRAVPFLGAAQFHDQYSVL